jgi:cell division protein FtsL
VSLPAERAPEIPGWLEGEVDRAGPSDGTRTPERAERAEGATRPRRSPSAPRTSRRRRHRVGFAIIAMAAVAPMLIGIVSLNALLAQTSFRIDEAERRIEELTREHISLLHEQARLSAPGRIAAWARRNGMRLPDDIRSLHASGGAPVAPAGAADAPLPTEGGA